MSSEEAKELSKNKYPDPVFNSIYMCSEMNITQYRREAFILGLSFCDQPLGRMVKSMEEKTGDGWIDRIIEETGSNNVKNIYFNGDKWIVEFKSDLPPDQFEFFDELYKALNQ